MIINSINKYPNTSTNKITFNSRIPLPNEKVKIAVDSISKILETPVAERSKHLIHESRDGVVNSAKFWFQTPDGTKISIAKSLARGLKELVKYLSITFEKDNQKETIRINSEDYRVLKPCDKIGNNKYKRPAYFSIKELEETTIPETISKYLSEITNFSKDGINKIVNINTISQPKTIPTSAIEIKPEVIIKQVEEDEKYNPREYYLSNRKRRTNEIMNSSHELKELENTEQLEKICEICQRFVELKNSFKPHIRKKALNVFDGVINRKNSSKSIVLKSFDEGRKARVAYTPKEKLLKIFITNSDGEVIKSYVIKNNKNIAINYAFNSAKWVSSSIHYCSEKEFGLKHPNYDSDINKIYEKMKEIEVILDENEHVEI